jgi:hypothetical protein
MTSIVRPVGTHFYVVINGTIIGEYSTLKRAKEVVLIREREKDTVEIAKVVAVKRNK